MAESDKREQILTAARHLILRQGLRATSMEAVAQAARVAKPTLYKYYGDKSALFEALVSELVATMHARFFAALVTDAPLAVRVAGALNAKYALLASYLEGSPFAEELLGEGDRMVAAKMLAADSEAHGAIEAALKAGGVADAGLVAETISSAAYGIFRKSGAAGEAGIRLLVERMVG